MLSISKPLSAGQARTYHAREFASEKQNYWSRDQQGHSEWQGRLAKDWGLQGTVGSEHFARLSEYESAGSKWPIQRYNHAWSEREMFRERDVRPVPQILVPAVFLLHVYVSLVEALLFVHHGYRSLKEAEAQTQVLNHLTIIHGDIKPENILLRWPANREPEGLPDIVLADFGAAQLASETTFICGTQSFDSPEVAYVTSLRRTNRADYEICKTIPIMTPRSDIYQLGHVMHLLSTYHLWPTGRAGHLAQIAEGYNPQSDGVMGKG